MTILYDSVIVGGGNLGLWTAYHLARRGRLRVAVCERHWAGSGATSRSAGMIRQQGGTVTAIRLGMRRGALYLQLGDDLRLDSGFHQTGYYVLAHSKQEETEFKRLVDLRRGCGLENEWVEPEQAAQRFPELEWKLLRGATFTASDGYVVPAVVVRNITLALLRTGLVELYENCPVERIESVGSAYRLETPRGILESGTVVNAGGPRGFREIGRFLGIEVFALNRHGRLEVGELPVTASRHQIVSFPRVGAMAGQPWPMVLSLHRGFYVRPDEHGILLGMTNPREPMDDSATHQLEFDRDYYEQARPHWEALLPALAGLKASRAWAAAVDRTPDALPILDEPRPGAFVVAAGSHGMLNGPALAEKLAERILDRQLTGIPADEVGLERFKRPLAHDPISLSPGHAPGGDGT